MSAERWTFPEGLRDQTEKQHRSAMNALTAEEAAAIADQWDAYCDRLIQARALMADVPTCWATDERRDFTRVNRVNSKALAMARVEARFWECQASSLLLDEEEA
tara:strand:+ start:51 stop:362 length:312 start_codon:yes stop_codon:yes gene_type:complete